jgi:hypothetical protein
MPSFFILPISPLCWGENPASFNQKRQPSPKEVFSLAHTSSLKIGIDNKERL